MSLMRDISAITKYKMLPRTATLLYPMRVAFMSASTIAAWAIRALISVEVILEESSTLIRVSSSRIYSSVDSLSIFKMVFSIF